MNQNSQLPFKHWKELAKMNGILLNISGAEIHNSIGSVERYHEALLRIYHLIRHPEPDVEFEFATRLAINAMNGTMNPEGLVPSSLVFGVLRRFPAMNSELPHRAKRMRALQAARAETETIRSESRLRTALNANLPSTNKHVLKAG